MISNDGFHELSQLILVIFDKKEPSVPLSWTKGHYFVFPLIFSDKFIETFNASHYFVMLTLFQRESSSII